MEKKWLISIKAPIAYSKSISSGFYELNIPVKDRDSIMAISDRPFREVQEVSPQDFVNLINNIGNQPEDKNNAILYFENPGDRDQSALVVLNGDLSPNNKTLNINVSTEPFFDINNQVLTVPHSSMPCFNLYINGISNKEFIKYVKCHS